MAPRTALERQVWESVNIDRLSTNPRSCLNLKSQWGLSQTPFLQAKPNKPGRKPKDDIRKGKRHERREIKEEKDILPKPPPGKRRRSVGPEDGESQEGEIGTRENKMVRSSCHTKRGNQPYLKTATLTLL